MRAQRIALEGEQLHVLRTELRTLCRLRGKVGIGDRLTLRSEGVVDRLGRHEPQPGGDVEWVLDARIDLLHGRAEGLELAHGRIDERGDLGIDIGVPQSGRVGDAHPADAVIEPGEVVDSVVGQRCPVAGIGLRDDVHHEGAVGHAHRVRTDVRHAPEG